MGLFGLGGCFLDDVSLESKACPCASGFVCDDATGLCVVPGSGGGADGGVIADGGMQTDAGPVDAGPASCQYDQDCGDSAAVVCRDGLCQPGCASGGPNCTANTTCDALTGHCLASGSCMRNSDCAPPLSVCEAGACVAGCTVSTGACRLDRECDFATGLCGTTTSTCTQDASCPSGFWCDGVSCRQSCDLPGAPECRGSSSCNASTGRCEGGLDLTETCTNDPDCASGLCLYLTIGLIRHQLCSRTCGSSGDCPLGLGCIPVSDSGHCLPGSLLSNNPSLTVRGGESCSASDNQCQSRLCSSSVCAETCSRDRDCPIGQSCSAVRQSTSSGTILFPQCSSILGVEAGQSCASDAQCKSGICDPTAGTCARLCCGEAECSASEKCVPYQVGDDVTRICRARGASGTAGIGFSCEQDSDCESELCLPQDPTNPGGAKVCNTYCCSDPDCDAFPNGGRCDSNEGPIAQSFVGACIPD